MRIIADTNTIVSGLLWQGPPRQILNGVRAGTYQLYTSAQLLTELEDVLQREKFARRLALIGLGSHDLALELAALATIVEPAIILPVVRKDPDDDAVLACALAASAQVIISGDQHLLELRAYQGIPILTATELLLQFPA
jgi:putative PIN family toxin of toxin-antitoxin system